MANRFSLRSTSRLPLRPTQLIAAAVVAAGFVTSIVAFGGAYSDISRQAGGGRGQTIQGRELLGAIATDMSLPFVLAAKELVPMGDTFAVETGPNGRVSNPVTLDAVRAYSQFQLFPRRLVDPSIARWLLCYGCDQKSWGGRFEAIWSAEPGLAIMRTRT